MMIRRPPRDRALRLELQSALLRAEPPYGVQVEVLDSTFLILHARWTADDRSSYLHTGASGPDTGAFWRIRERPASAQLSRSFKLLSAVELRRPWPKPSGIVSYRFVGTVTCICWLGLIRLGGPNPAEHRRVSADVLTTCLGLALEAPDRTRALRDVVGASFPRGADAVISSPTPGAISCPRGRVWVGFPALGA
jgi:hypothetical protein